MYNTVAQLLETARNSQKPLWRVIAENEAALTELTLQNVIERMTERWRVMQTSARRALTEPQTMRPALIRGQSARQYAYAQGGTLSGHVLNSMMAEAFSASEVNASMGRICAAPTAGACGILPAVLSAAAKRLCKGEEDIVRALFVASGFGAVITKNATVSGAEGGCQAECGTAAAISAAAVVAMSGGTPVMSANAAAIALINCMGLVCDPVAGVVQLPCSFRNASQSVNALTSADMALAGQSSVIPADEVIDAMYRVGKSLPSALRETAEGGLAGTLTGQKIAKSIRTDFISDNNAEVE